MSRRASADELIPGFYAEDERERWLVKDRIMVKGLAWGRPRDGHPEGRVGLHVADLLSLIEEWGERDPRRRELRFISLVHDSLKWRVLPWLPKRGHNHHAARACRFAAGYTDDDRLLATIALHDAPYAVWRHMRRTGEFDSARFQRMLDDVPDLALFLRFVELDGSTAGKDGEPVEWLREQLARHTATT
ncbi:MAG: hypothetical protein H0U20_05020 [Thermoleophilaceae bacterium]|nr:hypothetical protein [Thermoleophilaceae bacterium]